MNYVNEVKWDFRFLKLAKFVSEWSKDPSTQVGAVIVDRENRVVSLGYNGFPKNIEDDDRLLSREEKYKIIVHAEINSILFANNSLKNCIIYTYPFMPCTSCAGTIIQSGIKRVVSCVTKNPRWIDNMKISKDLFEEAGVLVKLYEDQI